MPHIIQVAPKITYRLPKLLDVFSSKTNLNLVLEFLDSDLEMIIKDRALVFLPADIKSWMAMTFRGLEFCHRNHVLHRVPLPVYCISATCTDIYIIRISSLTIYSSLQMASSKLLILVLQETSPTQATKWLARSLRGMSSKHTPTHST